MKRSLMIQKMISMALVAALVVGMAPASALAAEVPQMEDEPAIAISGDPMLGVQSGVEPTQPETPRQPRSLEELKALDCVILSEDGMPIAVKGSMEDISMEEIEILFGGASVMAASLDEADPNRELRDQFGLTDAQIDKGSDLHGDRLAYTNELSDLTVRVEGMGLSEEQVTTLADLISWGYSCPQSIRALVSKDLFGFTLDELKTARAAEIEADREAEPLEQMEQEGTDAEYLSGKLGLPQSLAEAVLETSGKDVQTLVQEMPAAMEVAYPTPNADADDEEPAMMFAATTGNGQLYAPEEVLGQPYSYDQQGNFDININNGSYSYTETDLNIPGKNGLDLVLTRQYHSDRANVMETYGSYVYAASQGAKTAFKVYFRWYEIEPLAGGQGYTVVQELTDHKSYTFLGSQEQEWANKEYFFKLSEYDIALATLDLIDDDDLTLYLATDPSGKPCKIALVPTLVTTNSIFENEIDNVSQDNSFYVDEFGLGHGWMLGLSHLRRVKRGYGDWNNWDTQLQLVLSNGAQYSIKDEITTSGNWIENYDDEDIIFRKCTANEYPNAVYGLYHKDGKVEYFNADGRNIAIKDRFGNAITIAYTLSGNQVKKIQITDTVGNSVVYEEVALDESQTHKIKYQVYNRLWQLSLNGQVVRKYYGYKNSSWNLGGGAVAQPQKLIAVQNEANEITLYQTNNLKTRFNSFMRPTKRNMNSNPLYANDGYNMLMNMHTVIYPNQAESSIRTTGTPAEAYGGNAYRYYLCCTGIVPMNSTDNLSTETVKYNYGDFDDLEGRQAWDNGYTTKVNHQHSYRILDDVGQPTNGHMIWKDRDQDYTFNLHHQNTKITQRSYNTMPYDQDGVSEFESNESQNQYSWLAQTTEYSYPGPGHNSRYPNIVKTTYQDDTSEQQIVQEEKYAYDKKCNVTSYTKPNGQVVSYTYDPTYSFPKTTTLKQDDNTTIVTTNTLSADNKSILSTEVTSNGALVGKTVYRYDSYGQLVAQDDYRDTTNYVTTAYTYDYITGAMPVQATVGGVRTADGTTYAASTPGFDQGTIARKQTYNKRGWLMSETDANGNTTSYTYDTVGRLTGATLPDGASVSYSYDVPNNAVTYTDQAGNQWKCTYGKSGKLLTVTDLTSNQVLQANTYDQYDQLVKKVVYGSTAPDQITRCRYDTDGRLVEQTAETSGGTILYQELYTYEQGAGKTTKTVVGDANAPSVVTTSYQDNMGNVVKTGSFRNGTEELDEFAYDYLGNQTQVTTAYTTAKKRAFTTQTAYDHAGRVLSVTNTLGKTAYKTYDWAGNQLTDKDLKGNVTTFTYDALGRLLRTSTPMDSKQTSQTDYTYDPNGNVTREKVMTGPSTARITDYTYNNVNRLTQVRGNAKQEGQSGTDQYQYTTYTYDALGNIAQMAVGGAANKHTTSYTYDRYSRLTQYKDALNQAETYTYDLNGLQRSKTDRRGITTTNTYDALGRLTGSVAGSDSVSFTYTKTGQRRTATANGETTTYTYDDRGNLIQEVTPVATKTMTYGIGDLRSKFTVTAGGKTYLTNTYDYDTMGRLTKLDGKAVGAASAHYSYGTNGNLASTTYGDDDAAHYTYNKANLPTEVKTGISGQASMSRFQYTYSRDGNQLTKTDDRGSQTGYVYDGLNRLTAETQTGALKAFSATYAYDDYGNRAGLTVDGVTTNYTYDANNRLLSNTDGTNTTTYTYDAQGNLTQSVLAVGDETHTVNCTYDNFNRLKKVSDNHGETVYTYDADGLRASKATNSSTERYVWDGDQLVVTLITHTPLYTGQIPDSGSVTGNNVELTAGRQYYVEVDGVVYSATAESNYVEVEEPTPLLDMADGETPEVPPAPPEGPPADFGAADTILSVAGVTISGYSSSQTVNVSAPAGTTVTLYARNPEASYNAYIRGLSLIAAQLDDKMYNYHYDAHGNVVQLVWGGGIVDRDYYYDAFGVEQNADDSDTNPFRYCGEQYDGETGNYYLRARYYTPGMGRFTQEDPARDGLNWYAYCAGNPVVFVDPLGLAQYIAAVYLNQSKGAAGAGHSAVLLVKDNGKAEYYSYAADSKYTVPIIAEGVSGYIDKIKGNISYPTVPGYLSVAVESADGKTYTGETEIDYESFAGSITADNINGSCSKDLYDRGIYIPITNDQGVAMHNKARDLRKNPGGYNLTQNNCTMIAMDILNAGNISSIGESFVPNWQYDTMTQGNIYSKWGKRWYEFSSKVTEYTVLNFSEGDLK